MTDRPNHRAAAERMLADADEWTAQAGEPTPEAGELSCLAYAAVHALLAIHDTLAAADRYAANEAKQREGQMEDAWQFRDWETVSRLGDEAKQREEADMAEVLALAEKAGKRWSRTLDLLAQAEAEELEEAGADPLDPSMAECSRCGETYAGAPEATMEHHRACTGETPENPTGDPLGESDHRDRLDKDGDRVQCEVGADGWLVKPDGRPVYIAPEPPPDAARDDLTASEGENRSEEGADADNTQNAILCPECGHGIDDHGWDEDYALTCCLACDDPGDCRQAPSGIAQALIERAVGPDPLDENDHPPRIKVARRWATLDAGAEHLGVTTKTLRNWIADGRLPGYRSGPRLIRVDLNELDALMQPLEGSHDAPEAGTDG